MIRMNTIPANAIDKFQRSADAVAKWVEDHNYSAYDPGDGNLSFLHALTFDVLILERVLGQTVYRSPFNLRPLLGIKPHVSTKGMGYMAWGYLKQYVGTGDPSAPSNAVPQPYQAGSKQRFWVHAKIHGIARSVPT